MITYDEKDALSKIIDPIKMKISKELKKFKNSQSFVVENKHSDLKIALENMEIKEKALN